jgi:hypothetical protein
LALQLRSVDFGNSNQEKLSFSLEKDYYCRSQTSSVLPTPAPSLTLELTNSSGIFPDVLMTIHATVFGSYSGVLFWRLDDHGWIAVREEPSTGALLTFSSTVGHSLMWNALGLDQFCITAGHHNLSFQVQSSVHGNSNMISLDFSVGLDHYCLFQSTSSAQERASASNTGVVVGLACGGVLLLLIPAGAIVLWRFVKRMERKRSPVSERNELHIALDDLTHVGPIMV